MTDLVESSSWTPGIRQFETSDPVEGGPDGIDNVPLRQLANRTRFLKDRQEAQTGDLALKAPIDSPAFTGAPQAPLAAQFDNSTKLATTSFVQRALGSRRAIVGVQQNTLLDASHVGALIGCNAPGGYTLTLPPLAGLAPGSSITFVHSTGTPSAVTVVAAGNDKILSEGNVMPSLALGSCQCLTLTTDSKTGWYMEMQNMYGTTAAQFDNSTRLATTSFVQQSLGNMAGTYTTTTSGTLGAAQAGKQVYVFAPGTTQTINFAELKEGARMTVYANYTAAGQTTLAINGPAKFVAVASATVPTVALNPGEAISLVVDGANLNIEVTTANLRYSAAFGASLATSGYQKLPSGLIIQWGLTNAANQSSVSVVFPIAFPNACLGVWQSTYNDTVGSIDAARRTTSATQRTAMTFRITNADGGTSVQWIAIGF
ncbi:hypothetical protein DF107_15445 [Burkholderia stagnalis]|uniref:gp53-like domain-containing protein n=1 Tax=Burkholderia stagnalis TaxID=1503054 RepID=UPI000A6490BA|nr:hypothetical protein [Burkholderia stagnalis]RQQ12628.1 hypothetical protein DF164_07650 [Burkholderia stagnalis]RQQ17691.1 hypothetical protein DF161_11915 [Burkholderia stagnalis]RQQ33949.1 hypothetical protein DF163_07700 [Burkholderia stagnalis]RQQ36091.1 hypothetical protein DF149_07795 [Burkholderia stagnalis]RQQ43009.1 hypothetical protein DF162_28765 [Burkholderia stagnalis]